MQALKKKAKIREYGGKDSTSRSRCLVVCSTEGRWKRIRQISQTRSECPGTCTAEGWWKSCRKEWLKIDVEKHAEGRQRAGQLNHHSALIAKDSEIKVQAYKLGPINVECEFCKSLNFAGEKTKDGKFTRCCQKGKLELKPIDCPDFLKKIVHGKWFGVQKFPRSAVAVEESEGGMGSGRGTISGWELRAGEASSGWGGSFPRAAANCCWRS